MSDNPKDRVLAFHVRSDSIYFDDIEIRKLINALSMECTGKPWSVHGGHTSLAEIHWESWKHAVEVGGDFAFFYCRGCAEQGHAGQEDLGLLEPAVAFHEGSKVHIEIIPPMCHRVDLEKIPRFTFFVRQVRKELKRRRTGD